LGCTHYPLLKGVISQVLGASIRLVDSAEAVADEAASVLESSGLKSVRQPGDEHHFYVTDSSRRFAEVGTRFLGTPLGRLEQVDITGEV